MEICVLNSPCAYVLLNSSMEIKRKIIICVSCQSVTKVWLKEGKTGLKLMISIYVLCRSYIFLLYTVSIHYFPDSMLLLTSCF